MTNDASDIYEVISLKHLLEVDPKIDWTVDRFIPKATAGLMAGDSGIGKTWMELDLAISIASGEKWLGKYEVEQGNVMIVDEENALKLLSRRMNMLLKARGIDEIPPIHFVVGGSTNFSPRRTPNGSYQTTDEFRKLIRTFKKQKPIWASFDSLTRVHRANENASNEMSIAFQYVKRLIEETNCGCMFTHHVTKKGNQIRGSGDIRAFFDYVLTIDKHALGVRCTHNKSRWDEPSEPFVAKFGKSKDEFSIKFAGFVDSEMVSEDANEKLWREIAGLLSHDEAIDRSDLTEQVEAMNICKQRKLDGVLKWACMMGYAERAPGKSARYKLNGVSDVEL